MECFKYVGYNNVVLLGRVYDVPTRVESLCIKQVQNHWQTEIQVRD
jgi:hypothetical protein